MLVLRGGVIYDGLGSEGVTADVVVSDDRIVGVGETAAAPAGEIVDVTGLAVVPGFVNVLSHFWNTAHRDPLATSDLMQGVTTEVFGEAFSVGPSDGRVDALIRATFGDDPAVTYDKPRLADGLAAVRGDGIAVNVASLVGGTNLRVLAAGHAQRPLTQIEIDHATGLLRDEMSAGAFGVGTALIYPPATFSDQAELVALCEVVAEFDGVYMSHLRSEGDRLLECLDELIDLSRRTGVRAEVYHLKAAGRANWPKMAQAVERIETARAEGLRVGASMYPYRAGATALMSALPPRFHDRGPEVLRTRLADGAARGEMADALATDSTSYENLFLASGGGAGVLLLSDVEGGPATRGRTLRDVAEEMSLSDADTLVELLRREPTIGAAFFMMSEDNVELGLRQPWVSVGSDAAAHPPEPPWTSFSPHPRTYGSFARVLGHYCRDRALMPFTEAVRRMTSLPAQTLGLRDRGVLAPGAVADIVVLDPTTVADRAGFEQPHQLAEGVHHVLVNGTFAVRDRRRTGAVAGQVLSHR